MKTLDKELEKQVNEFIDEDGAEEEAAAQPSLDDLRYWINTLDDAVYVRFKKACDLDRKASRLDKKANRAMTGKKGWR